MPAKEWDEKDESKLGYLFHQTISSVGQRRMSVVCPKGVDGGLQVKKRRFYPLSPSICGYRNPEWGSTNKRSFSYFISIISWLLQPLVENNFWRSWGLNLGTMVRAGSMLIIFIEWTARFPSIAQPQINWTNNVLAFDKTLDVLVALVRKARRSLRAASEALA